MSGIPDNDSDRIGELKARFPASGMFAGREWRMSPQPFVLSRELVKEIEGLGRRLLLFLRAANEIYLRSVKGSLPEWVAGYLDAGKPEGVVEWGRTGAFREGLPRVIRPDLLLGENGKLSITEIDNLPGGIGLTAWLNQTYAALGFDVLGGARGMIDGFQSLLDGPADIVVSEESGDYRPEMEWMAGEIGDGWEVHQAENYQPRGRSVYRFFELFDLDAIQHADALFAGAAKGEIDLTAQPKAFLEEKLWSALFSMPSLRETWQAAIRGNHLQKLRELFPYSWVVDPAPMPHFAVLPRLEVSSWEEVAKFSQKERELVLKISGFSDQAWGSRGVHIGHDLPQEEWESAIRTAMEQIGTHPWVLQEFRPTGIVRHPVWNEEKGATEEVEGRVRLCPYYFVDPKAKKPDAKLGGVLATIVPADKKVIHGMSDGALVPCVVETE